MCVERLAGEKIPCVTNLLFMAKTGRTKGHVLNCKKDQGKTPEELSKNKYNEALE